MAMTQPSETERLKQIRERLAKNELAPYAPDEWWADTHFLLSLIDTRAPVDSQGAGDDAAKERDQWKEFAEECKEGIRASHRILDELNVPREDAWLQETDGESYGIEEVVEYPVHERIKMLPPLAATQMRTACVERLGQVDRAHILSNNQDYERGFRDAIRSAQTALSSLTLEVKQI